MSLQTLIDQSNKKADRERKHNYFRRLTDKQLIGQFRDAATRVIDGCRAEYKSGRIADPALQAALRDLGKLLDEAAKRAA
jgi:hypothetical protein